MGRGFLDVALCILVSACGGSSSKTYTPREVRDALRHQGLKVDIVFGPRTFGRQQGTVLGLLKRFNVDYEGVRGVVSERNPGAPPQIVAWILDDEERAQSWHVRTDPYTSYVRKGNVVVEVRKEREKAVRAALDDLD